MSDIDWRKVFIEYMDHVHDQEGTTYLTSEWDCDTLVAQFPAEHRAEHRAEILKTIEEGHRLIQERN